MCRFFSVAGIPVGYCHDRDSTRETDCREWVMSLMNESCLCADTRVNLVMKKRIFHVSNEWVMSLCGHMCRSLSVAGIPVGSCHERSLVCPSHIAGLQHTATQHNTLHHTAPRCNTLQHTATHCNTLVSCVQVTLDARDSSFIRDTTHSLATSSETWLIL